MTAADIALNSCLHTIGLLQARIVALEIEKAELKKQLDDAAKAPKNPANGIA